MRKPIIIIKVPWPPSINHLYATVRGCRILSTKGRDYHKTIGDIILPIKSTYNMPWLGRLSIQLDYYPPTKRKYDWDGFIKCLQDGLQKAQAFKDDEQIDEGQGCKHDSKGKPGYVIVTLKQL